MPHGPMRPAILDRMAAPCCSRAVDLPELYAAALQTTRGQARTALLERARKSRDRVAELLALDDGRSPAASSPATLSAGLGVEGSRFLDAGALSQALRPPASASDRMPLDRRQRLQRTIAILDEFLNEAAHEQSYYMFSVGQNEQCADSFTAALEFCDKQLEKFASVLRALRVAHLEAESAFDAFHHAPLLERFDWQSADASELFALPPVVVLESVERLAHMSLTSFGRLLRSGRPVHVLITSCGLFSDDVSGFAPDFGYLSIAHREAFVLQSSLARPEHLNAGLAAFVRTLRPAVAVLCVPPARFDENQACLETSLLHVSRAFPLYSYDPDRGDSWAQRFQLDIEEDVGATLVDAAALSSEYREHFRVIPEAHWSGELLDVAEYLRSYAGRPPLAIPYVTLAGGERAVFTRELANMARDRRRAWRIFEELAGVNNSYAEAAAAKARAEQDETARAAGAREAAQRIAAMLTTAQSSPSADQSSPARDQCSPGLGAALAPDTAAAAAAAAATAAPEPSAETEDPYIDSFLCTSCNDCFKINNRLFAYDGNKQAYIADARAGTFAELVKAAEGCPAKCIHPGTPRPEDPTVTPQLLAKAARLK